MPAFSRLERHAASRDVRLPVDVGTLDVVEAAERVEVVLLVVVERRLVAHPPEQRMRVVPDLLRRRGRSAFFRPVRLPASHGIYRMRQLECHVQPRGGPSHPSTNTTSSSKPRGAPGSNVCPLRRRATGSRHPCEYAGRHAEDRRRPRCPQQVQRRDAGPVPAPCADASWKSLTPAGKIEP